MWFGLSKVDLLCFPYDVIASVLVYFLLAVIVLWYSNPMGKTKYLDSIQI